MGVTSQKGKMTLVKGHSSESEEGHTHRTSGFGTTFGSRMGVQSGLGQASEITGETHRDPV